MNIQRLSQSHRRRIFGDYYKKALAYGPFAYFPLWEPSGSVAACLVNSAQNGAYTGVTLGQPGIGDGHTCPLFDGTNDFCNIYSTVLASAFNGAEGTLIAWAKVNAASVWTDSTVRSIAALRVDNNNIVEIVKWSTNNQMRWYYTAGGTGELVFSAGFSSTDWMRFALTWSKTADQVKAYYNGAQFGSTQTGLGTWTGDLNSASTNIGCLATTPTRPWHGYIAHVQLYGRALPIAAILDLHTL